MEKFIIYSSEYRHCHGQFKKYLEAIGYSRSSCQTFEAGVREFLYWLEKNKIMRIAQVNEDVIGKFYNYQQERQNLIKAGTLSEGRIITHMYSLQLFFRHQQDTEQIEINPMNSLTWEHPRKRARENLLSVEDIEKLYDQCTTAKERAMLGIIYGCGLRKHEAVKLNANDIHFKSEMLYVREGKGGRKRIIPLSKKVIADLKDYYYNERPNAINYNNPLPVAFILNKHGRRMLDYPYSYTIKKLIRKAKLNDEITLHHFRHAIATHLLEGGMKMEHVKDFLGHKSIETTQTYTHITTRQMKKTTAYATQAIPA